MRRSGRLSGLSDTLVRFRGLRLPGFMYDTGSTTWHTVTLAVTIQACLSNPIDYEVAP